MANQNDAVMLFVQDLAKTLQVDPNEVIQVAQLNPEALKSAVEVFQQTQDIQQAAQAFQQSLQQLVQAAKRGAKLQYLKSLKNKCAEDEELYYFKKGGSVGCGCKKKEEGGKVTKTSEKNSSIEKFKNRPRTKEEQAKIDKLSELDYLSYKSKVSESTDERTPQQKAQKMKVEKKSKGSKMKLLERGSKCPKCGKIHSAGMGCSVAEFKKKFEKGGLLKLLKGSALPTAPKAKDRYKNGKRYLLPYYKEVYTPTNRMTLTHGASIRQYVKPITPYYNDTTYVEIPEHTSFVNVKPRVVSTNSEEDLNSPILDNNGWPTGHYKFKFNNSPEYETLKRRFNTAWNLAKEFKNGGNLLKKGLDGFKNTMTKTIVKGKDPNKFKYTRTINDYIDKKSGKVLKSDTTYSRLNVSFSNQPITTSPSSNEDDLLFKKVYSKFKKGFGDK